MRRLGPLGRVIAGVLGSMLLVGGILAVVLDREYFDGAGLMVLGAAGLYAAFRGREPQWYRD